MPGLHQNYLGNGNLTDEVQGALMCRGVRNEAEKSTSSRMWSGLYLVVGVKVGESWKVSVKRMTGC